MSRLTDEGYQPAEKLSTSINTELLESDACVAPDESFLIFVRQDGEGDNNMYLSVNTLNGWGIAEKLPSPHNDRKIDGSTYVTPGKRYLFWSSNRNDDALKTWQAPFYEFIASKLGEPL